MAATEQRDSRRAVHPERSEGPRLRRRRVVGSARVSALLAGLVGSLLTGTGARAADLPEDRAEVLFHSYTGGGVNAFGPALLVRKNVADRFSLAGTYYVDAVSNASIDVVTQASKYHEVRSEYGLSGDYVYRDSQITLGATTSREPDYTANALSIDLVQEVFGGMTTVSLGFTRGSDTVGKKNSPEFHDVAKHWQYRFGLTQILTPRVIASMNVEALADDGFLGSPYRAARAFGTFVPERNPRTRSARAVKFRVIGDLGSRDSLHADYRYYRDTWEIQAHTAEIGYSRHFGDNYLADTFLRYYTQRHALFYSDNATAETLYLSRNRQLSSFDDVSLGAKLAYSLKKVPGKYEVKLNGAYEFVRYSFKDFTDVRTGGKYASNASVLQLFVTATY